MYLQLGIVLDIFVFGCLEPEVAEERFNITGIKLLTIDVFKYAQCHGKNNLYIQMVHFYSHIKFLKITLTKNLSSKIQCFISHLIILLKKNS